MKKCISGMLAAGIAAATVSVFPATAAEELLKTDFESGLDGWSGRGAAQVAVSAEKASGGVQSAAVTGRTDSWNGIARELDSAVFQSGKTYSFSVMVTQSATPMPVHFKLSLQYSTGGGFGGNTSYDCIAESDGASGMWTQLSNSAYSIPEGASDLVLYVETEDSTVDFYVDDIIAAAEGSLPDTQPNASRGDVDLNGTVDRRDVDRLLQALQDGKITEASAAAGDLDANHVLDARDLSVLKGLVLNPPAVTTTTTSATTAPPQTTGQTVTTTAQTPQGSTNAKEFMAKLRAEMTLNVPDNVKHGDTGTTTHFTYFSQKAQHNKGANIWLPAGYSEDKQYPVLIMNHGIFGNEDSMLTGFSVREMASNMIASGETVPFIIVFPQMYTDPASEAPAGGITQQVTDYYDDFLYDLTESLLPYVKEHYSVAEGRENTAIAGFSMGGRETLYIALMRPDLFGYACASSPAPGVVPAVDMFLNHRGSMSESEFRFSDDDLPYLLMIGGGTNDGVVGTFPKEYHELFEKNGTDHIWMEVQGGGHDGSVGTPLFYNFFRYVFKA